MTVSELHLATAVPSHARARGWALPGLALAVSLTLAACNGSSGGSTSGGPATTGAASGSLTIGLVEQQLGNPFFGAILDAAKARAGKNGAKVITANSKTAGDSDTQVTAIQDMINRKVKGIVVDPANATALVSVIAQARKAGILVIAVNTETQPADAVDATFETDNLQAGKLIGSWAKATLGSKAPHVALLDYDLSDKTSKARHDGFLAGFGITEDSPEVSGEKQTDASVSGGQTAMENLLQAHKDINVVYGINEPMAQGAYAAAKAQGVADKIIFTGIDGSCSGVKAVQAGQIGATVAQFPTRMGEMAVDAILGYAKDGSKPSGITNSGTVLITDKAVGGIDSKDVAWGLENCWGQS
jgi:fructose transport system substrate-binding protein